MEFDSTELHICPCCLFKSFIVTFIDGRLVYACFSCGVSGGNE